ncbi:hypothetical protein [Armatimonas sp.]|uniref:hypothetical protein n=1 Tax=Armatimonas sp. TaxID=1872638 RepID=UPI003751E406
MNRRPLSCNDEALLLWVHGELSLHARLRQTLHLAVCPACRARRRQYARVSRQFAMELAQPGFPPRLGARNTYLSLPAPLWLMASLLLVIGGSLGTLAWQWRKANPYYGHSAGLLNECEGCLEDCLPTPAPLKKP